MTEITIDRDEALEILIRMDQEHELLGVELLPAFKDGYFDPDAHYTPEEVGIHNLAILFGFDYSKDIRAEAYRRNKEYQEKVEARLRELGGNE